MHDVGAHMHDACQQSAAHICTGNLEHMELRRRNSCNVTLLTHDTRMALLTHDTLAAMLLPIVLSCC